MYGSIAAYWSWFRRFKRCKLSPVNVVAGFLAVGACYVAYFNYIFLKRTFGPPTTKVMLRARQKYRMTLFSFGAAAVFLVITVFTSSLSALEIALIFVVVGALTNLMYHLVRHV